MAFVFRKILLVAWIVCFVTGWAVASPRIVAVGDVHGELDRLTLILRSAELIDDSNKWIGGDSIFVLTGDFTDRGPDVRRVMDLLMDLEKQASRSGGEVIVLLGNHEMMNIVGDLRYVTDEIYASFAESDSEKKQQEAFKDSLKKLQKQVKRLGDQVPYESPEIRERWKEAHPIGYVEYRKALGPKGNYGRWLRKLSAVVQVGDYIFLHGGIHPNIADIDLKELDKRLKKERDAFDSWIDYLVEKGLIESYDSLDTILRTVKREMKILQRRAGLDPNEEPEDDWTYRLKDDDRKFAGLLESILGMGSWLSMHPDGPLWFRGYARWTEEEGVPQIRKMLDFYGAEYFVVGHTITKTGGIQQRLGGRVVLIDSVEPVALEISGDGLFSICEDKRTPVEEDIVVAESSMEVKLANPR